MTTLQLSKTQKDAIEFAMLRQLCSVNSETNLTSEYDSNYTTPEYYTLASVLIQSFGYKPSILELRVLA